MAMDFIHKPVLFRETIEALDIRPGGRLSLIHISEPTRPY